jgi:hypothetical protein
MINGTFDARSHLLTDGISQASDSSVQALHWSNGAEGLVST